MSRTTVAWIAISLVAAATGCRMCASPYDYCSPTFTGTGGEDCAPFVRAGSILSMPGGYLPSEGYCDHPVPEAEEEEIARLPVDDQGASPILGSTSDQEIEASPHTGPTLAIETEDEPAPAVEGEPSLAIEIEAEPSLAVEDDPSLAIEIADEPSLAVEDGPSLAVEEGPSLAIELEEPPSDGWRAATQRSD
jgi:hypothetical protein